MKMGLVTCAAVLATAMTAAPAAAQLETCHVNGTPVTYLPRTGLGDIAVARLGPGGQPIVLYDPVVVQRAGPVISTFFYFHECAHHVLGHTIRGAMGWVRPFVDEQEADCWAIGYLYRSRTLTMAQLRHIQQGLAQSPGDWTHFPGPQRALNLESCLGGAGGGPTNPTRPCRDVTVYEEVVEYEDRMVPQQRPCIHCGPTPMGWRCMHPYDVVPVPARVPVRRQVPRTRRVCD